MQDSLDQVTNWCDNHVIISPIKTKSVTIATRQKHQLSPLLLEFVLCGVNILLLLRSFHWLPTQARIKYKL